MILFASARASNYIILAFLVATLVAQSVYANNFGDPNQCAKLLEAQKLIPSFKELINQKIRAAQDAQSKSAVEQKAEEAKRKEEEEHQKREAMDPVNLARKIQFVEIQPRIFVMGEGEKNAVNTEITKAYSIMDTKMTQMMYAQLMMLMGFKDFKVLFPSHFTDGPNSIMYDYNGTQVPMRPDDPVTNVSWYRINRVLIPILNKLSRSEDHKIQFLLKKIILDHQKDDVYDFVTEAQMENAMQLAKTADGDLVDDIIDEMLKTGDRNKLQKYVVFGQDTDSEIGTYPVASLLPTFIGDKPIYLHGNVHEWVKDSWDGTAKHIGGRDPLGTLGKDRSVRSGAWNSGARFLRSFSRTKAFPSEKIYIDLGFRLARVSRGSMHTNLGGTP